MYVCVCMCACVYNHVCIINPRRSEGYSIYLVCVSVSLLTTILVLQATRRLLSDTNSFSATRA